MPQQLTLRFDPRLNRSRADFHVDASNQGVLDALDRWPDWPSRVMLLLGPAAAGKSHLVEMLAKERNASVFAADAIDWHAVAAEISAHPPQTPVVVEDVGAGIDEAGLFHLINATLSASGWLLLTSRSGVADWKLDLPDLISRLRAATPLVIGPPNDATLEALLGKHFADRQMVVDPAVIRYSVARMERSQAAALELAIRLDAAALTKKSAITRAMAAEILGNSSRQFELPGLDQEESGA